LGREIWFEFHRQSGHNLQGNYPQGK